MGKLNNLLIPVAILGLAAGTMTLSTIVQNRKSQTVQEKNLENIRPESPSYGTDSKSYTVQEKPLEKTKGQERQFRNEYFEILHKWDQPLKDGESLFSRVWWDYDITTKEGETIDALTKEIYGNTKPAKGVYDANLDFKIDVDRQKPFTTGQKIVVYLPFADESYYREVFPDRSITFHRRP